MDGLWSVSRRDGLISLGVLVLVLTLASPCAALIISSSNLTKCSRVCESEHCEGPLLRWGKYCGVGYTGCAGKQPCDGLDRCCMIHDACIGSTDLPDNYVNRTCNENLRNCVQAFRNSGNQTFANANCSASAVETFIIDSMVVLTGSINNGARMVRIDWLDWVLVCGVCAFLQFVWQTDLGGRFDVRTFQ